jgi:hypothetical protein
MFVFWSNCIIYLHVTYRFACYYRWNSSVLLMLKIPPYNQITGNQNWRQSVNDFLPTVNSLKKTIHQGIVLLSLSCENNFFFISWTPVRIRVRIGPPHPHACRKSTVCTARMELWERGTRLLYKWQRKFANRPSDQLSSIATIWDRPSQFGVGNMFQNMVQPLSSLSTCVRSRGHLNVYLADLADF